MNERPGMTPKRFIAGALCPACSTMDSIKMWSVNGVPHRECVHCGYADTLDERGNSVSRELPTRVNSSALQTGTQDPNVKAVQFFPNPKLKKGGD
jgi:uncharacterized metal-binding protein (TIGR02443 family)